MAVPLVQKWFYGMKLTVKKPCEKLDWEGFSFAISSRYKDHFRIPDTPSGFHGN